MGVKSNDSVIYETFGMQICTEELFLENRIHTYSHVVQNVTENGPAAKMGIRDGDEVILINGLQFASYFNRPEVTEIFRNIKIDGKTNFSLLLHRRKRSLRFFSSVLWVATSAVLAPDMLDTGNRADVIQKEIHKSTKAVYCSESNSLYQISGEQKFLEICNNNVTVGVMTGTDSDKCKIIRKMTRISCARGDIPTFTYKSALSDILKKQFINIDGGRIVLQKTPAWFKMKMEGNNINFNTKGRYLAYAKTDVCESNSIYWFLELPADSMLIHIQASVSHSLTAPERASTTVDANISRNVETKGNDMLDDVPQLFDISDVRRSISRHEEDTGSVQLTAIDQEKDFIHEAEVYVHTLTTSRVREKFIQRGENTENAHVEYTSTGNSENLGQHLLATEECFANKKKVRQSSECFTRQQKLKQGSSLSSSGSDCNDIADGSENEADIEDISGVAGQTFDDRLEHGDSYGLSSHTGTYFDNKVERPKLSELSKCQGDQNETKGFDLLNQDLSQFGSKISNMGGKDDDSSVKQKRQHLHKMHLQDSFEFNSLQSGSSIGTLSCNSSPKRKDGSLSSGYRSDHSDASSAKVQRVSVAPLADPEDTEHL